MNKKFSTLVAALLLSGALFTVEAAEKTPSQIETGIEVSSGLIVFTDDVDLGNDYLVITEANTTIEGGHYTLKGRIVIKADGCKVHDLNIDLDNQVKNGTTAYKTAISVVAKSVEITGCKIDCSKSTENLANGITIFPTAETVKYNVSGNTIINASSKVDDWQSCGIQVVENLSNALYEGKSSNIKDFDVSSISNNAFDGCAGDYVYASYDEQEDASYKAIQVTPIEGESGFFNQTYINSLINNTPADADVLFNGTVEQLQAAVKAEPDGYFNGENAAVQCLGDADGNGKGNVLFGTVENPDNGQPAVIADVETLPETLFGLELAETAPSGYHLLIQASPNNDYYYAIVADENGKPLVQKLTKDNYATIAANKDALWKMTKTELAGNVYYTFENQNEVTLKIEDGNAMAKNGALQPVNNAEYNKGVVFKLDGGQGSPIYLETATKNSIFGLYEAGKNVLTVENLNYFEQDGFSVTIKYQDADGKFTKEDIAGNEFVGHLTPMTWNGSEFKEAADAAEEFYLKNADGEYIVVNAKDNGDVAAEDVLYFTTLSEEALEHHLARVAADDDQEYFGLFQAKVSASNQTDYKKLTVIDEMFVKLGDTEDDWASIGRWDKDSEPTLAASIETSLKPIQIALGSGKIVDKKAFLQKGKFYTVEIVASTEDNDPMVGKKLVAGAQDNDQENYWVKSYGNVLEGQFALTIEKDTDGKEYYVFTNRENLDVANSSYIDSDNYYRQLFVSFSDADDKYYEGIPVGSLYTTDEDNEYRYGIYTYKIDTVAGHKASDGYETLADVKNNKFYIGYASGVFGGNAWLVENHEGDENHVIGLDINQEDALIFTAKEYAAARQLKVEDKKSHKYYYAPSDSIYVISELGYFDGDDYKTTLDTLKLVSYTFVNQYTEPLVYNSTEGRYESDVYADDEEEIRYKNVEEAQRAAQHFALRIDGTKLNLRPVSYSYYGTKVYEDVDALNENWVGAWKESEYKALGKDADKFLYHGLNGWAKVYSGDAGEEGMLSNTNYLDREENDLFVVEPTEKPMYRTVINPLDTISIFRDDNSQSVLFEHNTFLGMENLSQYPEIAKAMIADTAYVRNNTYRPQYMLVVGADITPAGKWCPIHGDDPTCPDAHKVETSGWVEGRYLVNLVDTAIAWDAANKHKDNNPYINSEKYYRLGFVQAKHINDSLVIASTNDTLYVGSEDYNQAKFAFRYVDQEAGSFVIETANYKQLPGVEEAEIDENAPLGYLKWMNGVVVVVDDINNADVYNMNENETDTPTANEDIAVEEGVQVIAGNGAVTIQGAAGKTVVITNILGKAVANTTLTSDNQTINVPAGIVVVTVDGEAVKAIVK